LTGSSTSITESNAINDTLYHQVVAVYNGTDLRLYIDGKAEGTPTAGNGNTESSASPAFISRNNVENWQGSVSNAKLYSKALSAQEVKYLFENPYQAWEENNLPIWAAAQGGAAPTGSVNLLDGLLYRKRLIA
jgi:hypothetical protein